VTTEPHHLGGDYPPAHHFLRDLGVEVEHREDGTSAAYLTVVPEICDDTGAVRTGVLATIVDMIGGGLAAQAAIPNWIATADLTLHLVDRATRGTVEAVARVLRSGRTTVVIEVSLRAGATTLGLATMTFSVLPRRDSNPVIAPGGVMERRSFVVPGSGFQAPLVDEVGLVVVDPAAGIVELPVTEYALNSLGALQGGMVALAVDVAAEQALRAACGAPVRVTDMHITYLALVRGTLRSSVDVMVATPTHGTALVDVLDVGAESRRTTTARVVATKDR
jgi:uncharacterized protein (TIGR00369 family)